MEVMRYEPEIREIELSGFIACMPNDVYHSSPGISKSGLDLISRSPAHYYHSVPKKPSPAMRMGTAIHTAILEPERFENDYLLLENITDRRLSAYKEAAKNHDPELILTGPEATKVKCMQESIYAQQHARKILKSPGWRELSLFTKNPETGVDVRCRYDLITMDGICLDLKKTQDCRPDEFSKSILNYRYHVQAAFYAGAYFWATGKKLKAFKFLVVEEEPPHSCQIYELDSFALQIGMDSYRRDLNKYAECIINNDWPHPTTTDSQLIGLPEWYVARIENEIIEDIV